MNYNPQFVALSESFSITPGSTRWNAGGMPPWAASTGTDCGGPGEYWGHLTDWQAILANAAGKPIYYSDEPKRTISYNNAGRPFSAPWNVPDASGNDTDGSISIFKVKVWGMDPSHFHINPSLEVVKRFHNLVDTPLGKIPASVLARITAQAHLAQLAGMWRVGTELFMSDRCSACMLRAVISCLELKIHPEPADLRLFLSEYEKILDRWILPPKPTLGNKQPLMWKNPETIPNKDWCLQIYNGPVWMLPAIARGDDWTTSNLWDKNRKVQLSLAWLIKRLHDMNALGCAGISFPDDQLGKVQTDWAWLTPANIHYSEDDYTHWMPRSLSISGWLLNDLPMMKTAHEIGFLNHKKHPQWSVNAFGKPYDIDPVSKL